VKPPSVWPSRIFFTMNYAEAQQNLAKSILLVGTNVHRYYWRVSGNETNSLCRILFLGEEELKVKLRNCRILTGANDNFSKKFFDSLMLACQSRWTTYHLKNKKEWFIKIGVHGESAMVPKMVYDADGAITAYPVVGIHIPNPPRLLATKTVPRLLHFGDDTPPPPNKKSSNRII
jgi:hypothetical protein